MKTIVKLPISEDTSILIAAGERVVQGKTLLGKKGKEFEEVKIQIAQSLGVIPSKIPQYIKKRLQEKVKVGDVIAKKTSLFSTSIVKSPFQGFLKDIDLKKGTVTFVKEQILEELRIYAPVDGTIKKIHENVIEIEADYPVFSAKKAMGTTKMGKLIYVKDDVGMYDIGSEVSECIFLARKISAEAIPKLEVLGAHGMIVCIAPERTNLPWMSVDEMTYKELVIHKEKSICIQPATKHIIVLKK